MVEETGPGVTKYRPGDRVVALPFMAKPDPGMAKPPSGTYQQYLTVGEGGLVGGCHLCTVSACRVLLAVTSAALPPYGSLQVG